jgi:tetratricopeptide (TPR) repeat protein
MKRYQEAVEAFDAMLHIQPDFVDAYIHKGRALQELELYQDALAVFKRALEIDPMRKECWNDIGDILDRIGKHEEARICYEKGR